MNSNELGQKLVDLYNQGDFETIYKDLYSNDIRSIEADGVVSEGMAGIQAKNEWWENSFEVHASSAKGPYPHGDDVFAVVFDHDITHKESGQRNQSDEIGIYEVRDGRIVSERFCYPPKG